MTRYFKVTSGFEEAIRNWQRIASEGVENDILDAAEETAQDLLFKIQQDALEAGDDWYEVALQGQVVKTDSDVHLAFPQRAFDLEYGNPEEGLEPRRLVLANSNQMKRRNERTFGQNLAKRWGWT